MEEKIFKRRRPVRERLLQYGFRETADGLHYETEFMDREFRAVLLLDKQGSLTGKVIDVMNEEEYRPLRMDQYSGPYVNMVRNAYETILREIADTCFTETLFAADQSNRIANLILKTYGVAADFPFGKSPNEVYGTFRHMDSGKWFALIMNIKCAALAQTVQKVTGKTSAALPKAGAFMDVINLKTLQGQRDELYKEKGIYPAYHMNHAHWISVALDGSLAVDRVMQLVETSFRLTGKKH